MSEKRLRAANWLEDEREILKGLVLKYKDIIEKKKMDSETQRKKKQTWNLILDEFNSISLNERDVTQLKLQWKIMKIKYFKNKRFLSNPKPDLEFANDQIMNAIFGNKADVFKSDDDDMFDSDSYNDVSQTFQAEEFTRKVPSTSSHVLDSELSEDFDDKVKYYESGKEQMINYGDMNGDKFKEYLETENYKRQLLKEEIEFKRQLHQKEMQKADLDIEIKNEILRQLKEKGISKEIVNVLKL